MRLLKTPRISEVGAIHQLSNDENFKVIIDMLKETLAEIDVGNRYRQGKELYRRQGAAIILEELLERCSSAAETLNKLREAQKR